VERPGEAARPVARAVIGHHRGDRTPRRRSACTVRCRKPAAVPPSSFRQDLAEGPPARRHRRPCGRTPNRALDRVAAIATDPVPRPDDPSELLMSRCSSSPGTARSYRRDSGAPPADAAAPAAAPQRSAPRSRDSPHRPGDLRAGRCCCRRTLMRRANRGGRGSGLCCGREERSAKRYRPHCGAPGPTHLRIVRSVT